MSVMRMDNVGIVVADLDAAIEFFTELGLELEGRTPVVEGDWADDVTGLRGMRVEMNSMLSRQSLSVPSSGKNCVTVRSGPPLIWKNGSFCCVPITFSSATPFCSATQASIASVTEETGGRMDSA